ncbi:MAG TPA: acetylglutamate kinase [Fimbriimonas sp.]|nr:acetylglutamate kinase [Fimbriimonas sp.]
MTVNALVDFATLKTAAKYVRTFKDQTFVFKIGGELCDDSKSLNQILEQIAVLQTLGISVVIVHGGGKNATELGERLGFRSSFVNGRRITSEDMIEVAKMSFAGVLNTNLVAALNRLGVPSVGISGIDGGLVTAHRRPPVEVLDDRAGETRTVDFGFVADIDEVDTTLIETFIDTQTVPIICSLVADNDGTVLNINADTLASTLAQALYATKLIVLTQAEGVLADVNDSSSLISSLTIEQAQAMIADGSAGGGMNPKLTNAIGALQNGVAQVHIVSGVKPDAILAEVFTNEGSGTMITAV